jgi:hypothetical protein
LSSEELLRRAREGLLESARPDAVDEPTAPHMPVESSFPDVDGPPAPPAREVPDLSFDSPQTDPTDLNWSPEPEPEPDPVPQPDPEPERPILSNEQLESTWSSPTTSDNPSWDPNWTPDAPSNFGGGAPVGGPDPSTLPPPKPQRSSGGRFRGLYITAAILIGFFVFGALDNTTNVTTLSVGDCIEDPGPVAVIDNVEDVGCDQPHGFEVFALVELTGPGTSDGSAFPGDDRVYSDAMALCEPRFASYVGTAIETSVYWIDAWTPIEEGWEDGDREALCMIYELTSDFGIKTNTFPARNSSR